MDNGKNSAAPADNDQTTSSPYFYENRLLGFFDVLGFSSLLENSSVDSVHRSLSAFVDQAKNKDFVSDEVTPQNETKRTSNFEVTQFAFDTLVLVSADPTQVHADANFLFACIQIMKTSMQAGLNLRGAIGEGSVLADVKRGMLLSKEFPRLARLEKGQEWMGCCITDEAMARIQGPLFGNEFTFNPHSPVVPWTVPMKSLKCGQPKYAVNWMATTPDSEWIPAVERLIPEKRKPTKAFAQTILNSPGFRRKVDPPAPPVHEFRYMASRLKVNFLFLDESGRPVDPVAPVQISMSDRDGNRRTIVFQGK